MNEALFRLTEKKGTNGRVYSQKQDKTKLQSNIAWKLASLFQMYFLKCICQKMYFKKCIFQSYILASVFGQVESGNEWSIKLPDSIIPPVFRLQVFAEL